LIDESKIFNIKDRKSFNVIALKIFLEQYKSVPIYKNYVDQLNIDPSKVKNLHSIPFMPIRFFKTHNVLHKEHHPEITFLSSGTTNTHKSKHLLCSTETYEKSFLKSFELFYGDISSFTILALLPSYIEQKSSSLIYMVNKLIDLSKHTSAYISLTDKNSINKIKNLRKEKVMLIGVSYALLDLSEKHELDLSNWIIMETGGMKGRRKELTRNELHNKLQRGFKTNTIHSEYGMTELLSQAYSIKNGRFKCPPWMKVLIREVNDPFSFSDHNKTGAINIIDLANIYSCSFIATDDLGKSYSDESFEVLGRFDQSDLRGCNLLNRNI